MKYICTYNVIFIFSHENHVIVCNLLRVFFPSMSIGSCEFISVVTIPTPFILTSWAGEVDTFPDTVLENFCSYRKYITTKVLYKTDDNKILLKATK